MKVTTLSESPSYITPEGKMTPLMANENLSVIHLELPMGLRVPPHSHPFPGIILLTSGSVTLTGEEEKLLHEGDIVEIPADYPAGLYANEASKAILLSAPSRYKDLKEMYERFNHIF